ncbi:replication initiation negative regulator SeqA [Shewanella intestini]|uniref:Negative modulator of initiation of replication n=1 Tax=Shewanella intestini TaxID=2017544 RepID=A0ABS5I1K6_9GAMM|nr:MULTISPECIES: replication initiation negative regulator SeqA [Shewanella]MBR9727901.1 replication initiation negative regulator SeqA [Shewanella intestini]MRG36106.1 replication initiation negative regulator SeqA [Shewanella sp. XMDDZSB0408]
MKYIEIDEELYRFIASKTERIGESASDILRRLLGLSIEDIEQGTSVHISQPSLETKPLSDDAQNALFNKAKEAVEKLVSTKHIAADVVDENAESIIETPTASNALSTGLNGKFESIVNQHMLEQQKGAVGRFMLLLQNLAEFAGNNFEQVLQVQGKGRLYFARSKQELLDASKTANPKQIENVQFWVTTNNNTAKKQNILKEVLLQLGCDETIAGSIVEFI